jgi:hypothetical protein
MNPIITDLNPVAHHPNGLNMDFYGLHKAFPGEFVTQVTYG